MPIYTYLCSNCEQKFDLLVGVNQEREELKCPKCGSKNAEKGFSPFMISGKIEKSSSCGSCSGGSCSTCS